MKTQNTPNLTDNNQGFERRTFLAQIVATGLGSSAFSHQEPHLDGGVDPTCGASPADSLFLYIDLLSEIQFSAAKGELGVVVGLLKQCEQVLDEVYLQVKLLEAELSKAKMKAQAKQIRDLVEANRANARLIRDYLGTSPRAEYASLNTLAVFSDQVLRAAQNLQGEVVLSSAGVAALERIIKLVRDYKETQMKTVEARTDHVAVLDDTHKQIREIRKLLLSASIAISSAEDPGVSASRVSDYRRLADRDIEQAIAELKRVPDSAPEPPQTKSPRNILILLLEGTQKLIRKNLVSRSSGQDEPMFIRAASLAASAIPDSRQRVREILRNHCPPATWFRGIYCLALIAPILALFSDPDQRTPLIEHVLDLFPCRDQEGSMSKLAGALAQIQI
jgi:hypothetical protein